MTAAGTPRLVLASGSRVRAAMLRAAGLDPAVDPAGLDEHIIEVECRAAGLTTPQVAEALAAAKATLVSKRHPDALVVGADQMLELDGETLRKAKTRAAAAKVLTRLSGRAHTLISAVALARDGEVLWRHQETARLTMRHLDDAAIARYLGRAGDGVLACVGAYRLEDLGAQLFERVEGDYFTVLGLPLLAVLDRLRRLGETPPGLLL